MAAISSAPEKIQSVAVIGLGPGGLSSIKEFKAAGIPTVIGFDASESIGGLWRRQSNKANGVYQELTMNSTRSTSEFSDFPWNKEDFAEYANKDEYGYFPNQAEAGAYLEAYAKHFDLASSFRLGTKVTSIVRQPSNGRFLVRTVSVKGTNKEEQTQEFDAVMMCTGRFGVPRNPLQQSGVLKDFTGRVLHHQEVKSLTDFPNQRVLVVGGNVSGPDLAYHLSMHPASTCQKPVVNAWRTPHYAMCKLSKKGKNLELVRFRILVLPYCVVLCSDKSLSDTFGFLV